MGRRFTDPVKSVSGSLYGGDFLGEVNNLLEMVLRVLSIVIIPLPCRFEYPKADARLGGGWLAWQPRAANET